MQGDGDRESERRRNVGEGGRVTEGGRLRE